MDYKKLNELLSDFSTIRRGKCVEKKSPEDYETGFEVYHLEDNTYIKLTIYTDSYGDNEQVVGIEFVSPQVVQLTNFEPIN